MKDLIRVYRIIEYKGERDKVETTVSKSIHGTKRLDNLSITAETLGEFPESTPSPFEELEESYMKKLLTSRKIELVPSMDNLEENLMILRLLDKLSQTTRQEEGGS